MTKLHLSKTAIILIIISILGFIFYSFNLTSWKFIFVGDEWPFYTFAKNIADLNFKINPFSMNGVFDEHRVMGSLLQAVVIKLFPNTPVVGWRLSNTLLVFPLIFFMYFWTKSLFNKNISLYSSIFLSSSFVLANFSKIGYLNSTALALFVVCLFFATKAGQFQHLKDYIYLAISLAVSFYIYIGPLFPLIIFPCLFINYYSTKKIILIRNFIILIILYFAIIAIGPLTSHTNLLALSNKTIHREFSSNIQILINIWHNFFSFYHDYDYFSNHFVTGPSLDLISRFFCLIGTIVALVKIKDINYRLLLSLYFMTCFVIGLTSPYPYSPITRGIFFLPFGFTFAAIGLDKIINPKRKIFLGFIIVAIFSLNFYISQYWVFSKTGYSKTALILHELMLWPDNSKPLYLVTSADTYNYVNIDYIQDALKIPSYKLSINLREGINCQLKSKFHTIAFASDVLALDKIAFSGCYQTNDPNLTIISDPSY